MATRLQRGVEAFNAADFFTAHEIWEALWIETVGPEKQLLQGLVQIAAGYLKAESGIRGGAIKLLAGGLQRMRAFLPAAFGLSLVEFSEGVAADLDRLRAAADASASLELQIPLLQSD